MPPKVRLLYAPGARSTPVQLTNLTQLGIKKEKDENDDIIILTESLCSNDDGKQTKPKPQKTECTKLKSWPHATAICEKMKIMRKKTTAELSPEPPSDVSTVLYTAGGNKLQRVYWMPPVNSHLIDGYKVLTSEDGKVWTVKRFVNRRQTCDFGLKANVKIGVCSFIGEEYSEVVVSKQPGADSHTPDLSESYKTSSYLYLRKTESKFTQTFNPYSGIPSCKVKICPLLNHKVLCTPIKLTPLIAELGEGSLNNNVMTSVPQLSNCRSFSIISARYCFSLEEKLVNLILNSRDPAFDGYRIQVLLRFCLFDLRCTQQEEVPDCIVRVNNKLIRNKFDKHSGQIDITQLCNFTEGKQSEDFLSIEWMPKIGKRHCFEVCVAEKFTITDMVSNLMVKNVRERSTTQQMVQDKFNSDKDLSCIGLKASLNCPLGKTRMISPCRGSNCKHIQCMDALTLLKMNEGRPLAKNKCYMCDEPVTDIYIDGLFLEILSTVPESVNEIEFQYDGSWSYEGAENSDQDADQPQPINNDTQKNTQRDNSEQEKAKSSHHEPEVDILDTLKSHLSRLKAQVDQLEHLTKQHELFKEKEHIGKDIDSDNGHGTDLIEEDVIDFVDLTKDEGEGLLKPSAAIKSHSLKTAGYDTNVKEEVLSTLEIEIGKMSQEVSKARQKSVRDCANEVPEKHFNVEGSDNDKVMQMTQTQEVDKSDCSIEKVEGKKTNADKRIVKKKVLSKLDIENIINVEIDEMLQSLKKSKEINYNKDETNKDTCMNESDKKRKMIDDEIAKMLQSLKKSRVISEGKDETNKDKSMKNSKSEMNNCKSDVVDRNSIPCVHFEEEEDDIVEIDLNNGKLKPEQSEECITKEDGTYASVGETNFPGDFTDLPAVLPPSGRLEEDLGHRIKGNDRSREKGLTGKKRLTGKKNGNTKIMLKKKCSPRVGKLQMLGLKADENPVESKKNEEQKSQESLNQSLKEFEEDIDLETVDSNIDCEEDIDIDVETVESNIDCEEDLEVDVETVDSNIDCYHMIVNDLKTDQNINNNRRVLRIKSRQKPVHLHEKAMEIGISSIQKHKEPSSSDTYVESNLSQTDIQADTKDVFDKVSTQQTVGKSCKSSLYRSNEEGQSEQLMLEETPEVYYTWRSKGKRKKCERKKLVVDKETELAKEDFNYHVILRNVKTKKRKFDMAPPTKTQMRNAEQGIVTNPRLPRVDPNLHLFKCPSRPFHSKRLQNFFEKNHASSVDRETDCVNPEDASYPKGKMLTYSEKLSKAVRAVREKTMTIMEASTQYGIYSTCIKYKLNQRNINSRKQKDNRSEISMPEEDLGTERFNLKETETASTSNQASVEAEVKHEVKDSDMYELKDGHTRSSAECYVVLEPLSQTVDVDAQSVVKKEPDMQTFSEESEGNTDMQDYTEMKDDQDVIPCNNETSTLTIGDTKTVVRKKVVPVQSSLIKSDVKRSCRRKYDKEQTRTRSKLDLNRYCPCCSNQQPAHRMVYSGEKHSKRDGQKISPTKTNTTCGKTRSSKKPTFPNRNEIKQQRNNVKAKQSCHTRYKIPSKQTNTSPDKELPCVGVNDTQQIQRKTRRTWVFGTGETQTISKTNRNAQRSCERSRNSNKTVKKTLSNTEKMNLRRKANNIIKSADTKAAKHIKAKCTDKNLKCLMQSNMGASNKLRGEKLQEKSSVPGVKQVQGQTIGDTINKIKTCKQKIIVDSGKLIRRSKRKHETLPDDAFVYLKRRKSFNI